MVNVRDKLRTGLGKDVELTYVQHPDGTHSLRVLAEVAVDLYTDNNGPHRRIRVDTGSTAFFAGREFDVLYEFSILEGARQVIRVIASADFLLIKLELQLLASKVKMTLLEGGTPGGSFSTALTPQARNKMSNVGAYTTNAAVATGGTHTGGMARDIVYGDATVQGSQTHASIASEADAIGFPAGTYYVVLENTGNATATGAYHMLWDERPIA